MRFQLRMGVAIGLWTVLFSPLTSAAAKVLTQKEILKIGLDYSQEIKKSLSQVREAEDNTSKAQSLIFPTFNGKGSVSTHQNSTTTNSGSVSATGSGTGQTYLAGIDLIQPLYAGGGIGAGIDYYRAAEDIAKENLFQARQDAASNILAAFYSLAQAQLQHEAATANREILKNYVDTVKHYQAIGRARKMDEMQSQVNYTLALADVENLKNNLETGIVTLSRLLGADPDPELKVEFKFEGKTPTRPEMSLNLPQAFAHNPSVRAARLRVEQVSYSETIDLALDHPSINLFGSAGYQSSETSNLFQSGSQYYSAGVNLTIPIFSGFSSYSKRAAYGERKFQAERDLRLAQDAVRVALENAVHSLKSALDQYDLAQTSVKQARTALEMANAGFRHGIASNQDVINLQNTRYTAEKFLINTQFAYLQALLSYRRQMGIDLEKASP